ncbi:MAG TPA: hypothetical protein VGU02_11180, partial [Gaiellaceae bacterium]|nr:hypothetical protein [Gaiellaceae bacterium]
SVGGAGHFTVVSSSQIRAAVPNGAPDGPITVVRSAGNLVSATALRVLTVTGLSSSSLYLGDTLTITGANLGAATGVTFPGHAGPVAPATVTSTSLQVVVPSDASNGSLTVSTSDLGSVGTPALTIIPLPSIAGISATNTPSGSTLHINGANFVGVTAVTIGSDNVTSAATVDSSTSITVAIPVGESTGAVRVTTGSATSSASPILYAHTNGLGQTYYDADPANTYDLANGTNAASVFDAGTITQTTCDGEAAIQLVTASEAAVWVYGSGALQGHVGLDTVATTPVCPTAADPAWG